MYVGETTAVGYCWNAIALRSSLFILLKSALNVSTVWPGLDFALPLPLINKMKITLCEHVPAPGFLMQPTVGIGTARIHG